MVNLDCLGMESTELPGTTALLHDSRQGIIRQRSSWRVAAKLEQLYQIYRSKIWPNIGLGKRLMICATAAEYH